MSDASTLVFRLRDFAVRNAPAIYVKPKDHIVSEAADRIEELEALVMAQRARIAQLEASIAVSGATADIARRSAKKE